MFQELEESELPPRIGRKYMDVVLMCCRTDSSRRISI
jgi:hypothetical protein